VTASGSPLSATESPETGSLVESDTNPPSCVAVDRRILTWLTMAALTDICVADDDIGCCPACCAPCAAIKALLTAGQLDDTVRDRGPGWDWWDESRSEVDRELLARAWRLTKCCGRGVSL